MEFNSTVIDVLFPILGKYNFKIEEELENVVRFMSPCMEIGIVFNKYDRTNFIEMGRIGDILVSLTDNAVMHIFEIEMNLENVDSLTFVQNLLFLFQQPAGIAILKCNIEKLLNMVENEGKKYTFDLVQKQSLNIATKFWENKQYYDFINFIETIDINSLPKSYLMKYKIAQIKLVR